MLQEARKKVSPYDKSILIYATLAVVAMATGNERPTNMRTLSISWPIYRHRVAENGKSQTSVKGQNRITCGSRHVGQQERALLLAAVY